MTPSRLLPAFDRPVRSARGFPAVHWLVTLVVLVGLGTSTRAMAGELCQLNSSCAGSATVISVAALGATLSVDLAIEGGTGPVELRLESRDGTFYGGKQINPTTSDGSVVTISLGDVLAGTEHRDIHYRLHALDADLQALMSPFPFAVIFDCPVAGSCSYELVPGFETNALLITPGLARALEELPPCNLALNLRKLRATSPRLRGAVQTLVHQLSRQGLLFGHGSQNSDPHRVESDQAARNDCVHAWAATPTQASARGLVQETESDTLIAEAKGFGIGAGLCHSFQGTHRSPDGKDWTYATTGESRLKLRILCVEGAHHCADSCQGRVNLSLRACQCAAAEVESCDAAVSVAAEAGFHFTFEVNDTLTLENTLEAVASVAPNSRDESLEVTGDVETASSLTPVEVVIKSEVDFSYSVPTTVPMASAGAHVYGETNGVHYLAARGASQCAANKGDALMTSHRAVRSGGLKLRRWYPPDEVDVPFKGATETEAPPICQGVPVDSRELFADDGRN